MPFLDFYYGLNINAEYKNFDFTFFASGSSGGVAVNNMYRGLMSSQSSGNTNYHEDILSRWTQTGMNTGVPRMIYLDPNLNGRPSDRPEWLQKTNYLRLNTISIGYSLSPGGVGKDEDHKSTLLYYWSKPVHVYALQRI